MSEEILEERNATRLRFEEDKENVPSRIEFHPVAEKATSVYIKIMHSMDLQTTTKDHSRRNYLHHAQIEGDQEQPL
jgi:hypothetical protein